MQTVITIKHDTVADLKTSQIWANVMALFLVDGPISVVGVADDDGHASDCATHNGPAYQAGDCDCK